jgi:hypothetical protein
LLAVAITAATAVVAAVAIAFAAAIADAITITSTVIIAAASTDVSASARLASPDAWACGDDSPSRSRRNALELEAWWRGLEINDLELGVGRSQIRIRSSKF